MMHLASDVWVAAPAIAVPDIPGYEIVRELGRGGMGSVFLARQRALADRLVAVKVMPHASALSQQARTRFRNEVQALARIRHPNVIDIYEVIDVNATPAYAMEWVDGRSLLDIVDHWVATGRPVESRAFSASLGSDLVNDKAVVVVVRWGLQVANALAASHGEGLLHRDVKPSNIMVRRDGAALLTDFGLVRDAGSTLATRTGAFLGTPAYAAPEQLRGEDVDERADVYGLGATLYHALAGVAPFGHLRQVQMLRAVDSGALLPLRKQSKVIDRDLATIVETAMEADIGRRYASAADMGADLQRYLDGRPIEARPAGALLRLGKYVRRNRSGVRGAAIGSIAAIVIALLVAAYAIRQAQLPADFAEHVRKAHLTLLDPTFDERMSVMLHHAAQRSEDRSSPTVNSQSYGRLEGALRELDAALDLIEDAGVRADREAMAIARQMTLGGQLSAALAESAPKAFEVAAAWSASGVRPDPASIDFDAMARRDRRCLGLLGLLQGADALCIEAWRGLDLAEPSDPLIDAALGQLYRQRGDAALAWPRLERAFDHFREAEFLGVAIAEVALASGDPAYALRVFDRIGPAPELIYDQATRVHADTLSALGRRDEARELYLRHAAIGNVSPSSHESLAKFFLAEGNFERAMHHRWRQVLRWPSLAGHAGRVREVLQAMWRHLSAADRRELLLRSLREPGSFLDQLAFARQKGALPKKSDLGQLAECLQLSGRRLADYRQVGEQHESLVGAALRGQVVAPVAQQPSRPLVSPLRLGKFEHVSKALDGGIANAPCLSPCVSADARLIAFSSRADNLVAGDDDNVSDIFLRDRGQQDLRRVHAPGARANILPAFSADRRWLAFWADHDGVWHCWLYSIESGEAQRVADGLGCAPVDAPSVSADGSLVLCASGPSKADSRLVLWHVETGRREWTSPASVKGWVGCAPKLSSKGRRVLAKLDDGAFMTPDANGWMADVYAFDLISGGVQRISDDGGRQADVACHLVGASPDLRYALLWSLASNLATIDRPGQWNLFLRDAETGSVVRVNQSGASGLRVTRDAAQSNRRTVFCAYERSPSSKAGETARREHVQLWLRSPDRPVPQLLTRDSSGSAGVGSSAEPSIDAMGDNVVFQTTAANLLGEKSSSARASMVPQIVAVSMLR